MVKRTQSISDKSDKMRMHKNPIQPLKTPNKSKPGDFKTLEHSPRRYSERKIGMAQRSEFLDQLGKAVSNPAMLQKL